MIAAAPAGTPLYSLVTVSPLGRSSPATRSARLVETGSAPGVSVDANVVWEWTVGAHEAFWGQAREGSELMGQVGLIGESTGHGQISPIHSTTRRNLPHNLMESKES